MPSLRQRLDFHAKNLAQQGVKYLLKRAKTKLTAVKTRSTTTDAGAEFRDYAFDTHVPQPYSGKAVLFRTVEESHFETLMAWKDLILGSLKIYDVPGDHLGTLHKPNVRILAEKLKACIEKELAAS
ncbi:MAG: hypothetical protein NZ772_03145 [Cyanobacteria bacterium]|nr:hypothetical protein [Cyanobacteriota bacterium]